MVVFGTMYSISSNSFLGIWIGLEINLISIIPLLVNLKNINTSEASLNYFLIQALASISFLFTILIILIINIELIFNQSIYRKLFYLLLISPLLIKLGAAPFHFWFPNLIEFIDWNNSFIIISWQKVAPIIIISYLKINIYIYILIILSSIVGAVGGINQNSLRKLLAYSSINHIGWIFSSILINISLWITYFFIYSFINLSIVILFKNFNSLYINQINFLFNKSLILKFYLFTSLLSLGGLPPFLGFFPKLIIIENLIFINIKFLALVIIIVSLIILTFYLKIIINLTIINKTELNWISKKLNFLNNLDSLYLVLNLISSLSLIFILYLIFRINII